ncbi:MAG: ArnT family glycosyltransferase [Candidatus Binatia bacterium]
MRSNTAQRWALAAVLLLALGLRTWQLEDVPAGLYCDEAANGYNAYAIGTAGIDENGTAWPLYVWSFRVSYKNPIFIYAAILPVKAFGLSAFSVRITAALFGVATVWALFCLGRALYGPWVGFWSALLLAVSPWHLHFSRIAFELIAFPFLFTVACTFLVRFTQGRRTLPAAFALCALCVYAYAPAVLFVPLFLAGFVLLYARELLRHWRQTLIAIAVAGALLAPAAAFFAREAGTGTQYFRQTTYIDTSQPWRPQLERFAENYGKFFSAQFLVHEGDPLQRHAVRGFGELYPVYVPLLFFGAATALLRGGRFGALLLWWLALYPVAPSLMNEIPSASRGIIGIPVFCLLSGLGLAAALRVLRWIAPRRRWGLALQAAGAAAVCAVLAAQVHRYLRAYFVEYPTYAALTPGGFQFGYRDVIAYMESQRSEYDLLLLSYTDANQPLVFAQFYRALDPREWAGRRDAGYVVARPEAFNPAPAQRVLAALHPNDTDLYSDLNVKRLVEAPGGKLAFVIAELTQRRRYLREWLLLGPFPNDDLLGSTRDFIDPADLAPAGVDGPFGFVRWYPLRDATVHVDLNRAFASRDPRHPGNPEQVCAYAATTVRVPSARRATLELSGSVFDTLRVWLNGRPLSPWSFTMGREPKFREVELRAGDNGLLVQSCEDAGDWSFNVRLTDAAGHDMTDVTTVAELPLAAMRPDAGAAAPVQLVEGFAIAESGQAEAAYPDYRGGSPSWRSRVEDHSGVTWRTAPVPEATPTVFAFTGSTSDEQGDFKLFVDGRYALTFQSHPEREVRSWTGNGVALVFVSKASAAGNSGFYLLSVPAEWVAPGRPVELRVEGAGGDPSAWFMVKEFRDTLLAERVSPAAAAEATGAPWQTRHLAYLAPQ